MLHTRRTFGYEYPSQEADIVLIGVPFDSTQTGRPVRYAPLMIREAIKCLIGWDPQLKLNIFRRLKFSDAGDLDVVPGSWELTRNALIETLDELLQNSKAFPVILGGEHLVTLGVLEALFRHTKENITVVHFDAHRDLKDEWMGEKYSHTTWARRALESTRIELVQIGCRVWDMEEEDALKKFKVKEVLSDIGGPVYLTIDLDVFDPSVAPDVGTPQPSGMFLEDFLSHLKKLPLKNLVGFDIVECASDKLNTCTACLAAEVFKKVLGYWVYGKS